MVRAFIVIAMMTLSVSAAFSQSMIEVARMTVADDRTNNIRIQIYGTTNSTVNINGEQLTFQANDNYKTFSIDVSTDKTIIIKSDDTSSITWLSCNNNQLTYLDVSGLSALSSLDCSNNLLTSLNASGCDALKYLFCSNNLLSSLDLSGCDALEVLNCYQNSFTSLDISGFPVLYQLLCFHNSLTSLTISECDALRYLDCSKNLLTSLDVSGFSDLEYLYCERNSLTSLDVSGISALEYFDCSKNALSSLDISGCVSLKELYADNQTVELEVSFNYNRTDYDIIFNGKVYTFPTGEVFNIDLPSNIPSRSSFSGIAGIVRSDDSRSRYKVNFINKEGVSTNRALSTYDVIEGHDFQFQTTIDNKFSDYTLTVYANGKELSHVFYKKLYIIENINEDKVVTFQLTPKETPTTNQQLKATKISTGVGTIAIEANNVEIQITSLNGKVIHKGKASGTLTVNAVPGAYAVTVNGQTTKVIVR